MASLMVSQHANCTVTVTITNRTSSGENKFKMIGLMVSDSTEQREEFYLFSYDMIIFLFIASLRHLKRLSLPASGTHGFTKESEFTGAFTAQPE